MARDHNRKFQQQASVTEVKRVGAPAPPSVVLPPPATAIEIYLSAILDQLRIINGKIDKGDDVNFTWVKEERS